MNPLENEHQAIIPESPIRELYQYLASKKPFRPPLFPPAGFHRTADVQKVVASFDRLRASDVAVRGKRLLGVYSNIGDGKTTLLAFLNHLKESSFLPILIDFEGAGTDPSRILFTLIKYLLFHLREHKLLEEKLYNDAKVEFKRAPDSEAGRSQVIQEQMRLVYPVLSGRYLIWLCDNVKNQSCLQAFQQLLDLRDPEPPALRFFAETPVLVVFSTSDIELLKAWKDRVAAGHVLESLGVRADDMFHIVSRILDASFQGLPDGLRQRAEGLRLGNPVFPIEAEDLRLFLKHKAKKERLEQPRNDVTLEVAEIQLRNTLELLQRLVDAAAVEGSDRPIDLRALMREDIGSN